MESDDYTYEIITTEADARQCAQLLAEEFSSHNLITLFDRIDATTFFNECAWPLTKNLLAEHLSYLARHRPTGEIVAVTLAGDLYFQHASDRPHNIPIDDLLEEMDHLFVTRDFGEELKPNMVLHISLGAVRFEHSGKGLASGMRRILCNHARDQRGFPYALVQVTSQATRHIYLNKMAGREVTIVDPRTWIWKKNTDQAACPYKDYRGGVIPNILLNLSREQ